MSRKAIAEYLTKIPEGWIELQMLVGPILEETYSCSYINRERGAQLLATVKDYGCYRSIHVSLGPIYSLRPDLKPEDLRVALVYDAGSILAEFFGERKFARAPDDQRKPDVIQCFHVLEQL